ncbi:16791_t:CDS:1 [Funneliformis geosporum]|nr:16791_t:CDS:1 [Funneliformis geosporum]
MALKRFYMRNIYGDKDIDNKIWNNLCNKKFVKYFSLPEPQKYFLMLSHFQKQGYNKENAIKGLEAKNIAQWKDTHYKTNENIEKSVAEDLHKSYSANHWKDIRELFQILGFTSIDNKHIISGNIVLKAFT